MIHNNLGLIVALSIIILNPWWWIILQRNLTVGLLAFVLSLVFYIYFWQNKLKKLLLLIFILTLSLIIISLQQAFDESIFRNSALDIQQINKRHEFYAKGLGKIYTNRITLTYFRDIRIPLIKLQRNLFSNLDLNLYFFASHPRERLGVDEIQKYFPIFLPLFVIGLIYLILFPKFVLIVYLLLISLTSAFISEKYNLGPILFFPIVNFIITIGTLIAIRKLK